ncbi:thiaminase II [Rodentibacter trehalosifermentans]|uniref:Aminopyrimidine aminohydrolase n=1 Tax=Rodentibacter trehalosifermentans TaxID=1908263 RepID=A0A1V3IY80_9PAST|nr:thiaminase II [Rodentibacter trehalosifermentans]OOF47145.1 thiaminase II [Rodentibacter trehalosifermentans]
MIIQFIEKAQPYWKHYVEHPFVQQLAQGTLPKHCFQHYLKQDYLYLFHYSRAFALGIFKAKNFAEMDYPRKTLEVLHHEIQLHLAYCKQWGISEAELFNTQESAACVAYTRYVLDCGITGGLSELYAAITPCIVGYVEAARYITIHYPRLSDNPYQSWIDTYASEEFQQAAKETAHVLTAFCQECTPTQLTQLQQIFTTATRMEINFWQMGLDLA